MNYEILIIPFRNSISSLSTAFKIKITDVYIIRHAAITIKMLIILLGLIRKIITDIEIEAKILFNITVKSNSNWKYLAEYRAVQINEKEYATKVTAAAVKIPNRGISKIFKIRFKKADNIQIRAIIFVFFFNMIIFAIMPYIPDISALNATNGVTKYPFKAISGVVRIVSIGFDKRDTKNTVGTAAKMKYFNEYFRNILTLSISPLS